MNAYNNDSIILITVKELITLNKSHWCSSDENFKQCHGMTNDRSKYQVCKPYL